jgi:phage protein U
MPVFAILGEIPFEVTSSPEALVAARHYDYAEHRVIEGRPRLQWIADALETIRLELLLHRTVSDPAASLALLQVAASSHSAMPLVFGNGDFRGYFVIVEIETLSRQLSGTGDPLAISVKLTLREFVPEFDPAASSFSSFVPIAIAAFGTSALLAFAAPAAPISPRLQPADVRPATIVRAA